MHSLAASDIFAALFILKKRWLIETSSVSQKYKADRYDMMRLSTRKSVRKNGGSIRWIEYGFHVAIRLKPSERIYIYIYISVYVCVCG